MKWEFILTGGLVSVTLKAEIIYTNHQIEEISVTGDGITIVLQNNRPLLVAIERNIPITWKLVEGQLKDSGDFSRIITELESYLKTGGVTARIMPVPSFPSVKKSA